MAGGMRPHNASAVLLSMRGRRTTTAPDTTASRRHCWIHRPDGDLPGLILQWRRHDLGWQALTTYVDGPQIVTAWLPADALRPG